MSKSYFFIVLICCLVLPGCSSTQHDKDLRKHSLEVELLRKTQHVLYLDNPSRKTRDAYWQISRTKFSITVSRLPIMGYVKDTGKPKFSTGTTTSVTFDLKGNIIRKRLSHY